MITFEKIESSLFAKLYDAFLFDDDPLSDEQDWRNVFDYRFENEQGYCGYAMLEDGQVVGMLGMVFSKRFINGETRKFCNLHTWWVREDYRGRSVSMLRPILKLDDYTITHFTPCDRIRALTKRLGFKELSSRLKILLPSGAGERRVASESQLSFDEQIDQKRLGEIDRRIMRDHIPYGVGHLLIQHRDEPCYLLYTHVVRHRLPYCHIHYISNKASYLKCERVVRSALLERHSASFVAVDARLVRDSTFPYSFNFWAPAHALYKSSDVAPGQIDNLYSDVVFLKLTVLPNMSHEFRELARRCLDVFSRGSRKRRPAA